MPSHLEKFSIEIDKALEKWEMDHETEYNDIKLPLELARLRRLEADGQRAALENQRANFIIPKFPKVRYLTVRPYIQTSKCTRFRNVQEFSKRLDHQDHI